MLPLHKLFYSTWWQGNAFSFQRCTNWNAGFKSDYVICQGGLWTVWTQESGESQYFGGSVNKFSLVFCSLEDSTPNWFPKFYCGRECTGLAFMGAVVRQCGLREAPERQPHPGWGRHSFSQKLFDLFLLSQKKKKGGGIVSVPFFLQLSPLVSLCSALSSLSVTSLSPLAILCYPSHVPGCHPGWLSLSTAVTSLTQGLPCPCCTSVRAGVAMVQSCLEGESFCYSGQGSSHIPAQPKSPKGEYCAACGVLGCSGAAVQAAVGLRHACIKQWFPTQCTHNLSDCHKLSTLRISSESCSAFEEQFGKVTLFCRMEVSGCGRRHVSLSLLFSTVLLLVLSYKTNPGFQGTFNLQLVLSWSYCREQVPGWFTSSKNKQSGEGREEGGRLVVTEEKVGATAAGVFFAGSFQRI